MADSEAPLFITDDEIARRVRAVADELRNISSRRRSIELANELEDLARTVDPSREAAA